MNARNLQRISALLGAAALLAACARGHNGTVSTLPSSIAYPAQITYVVGSPITALRPTLTGSIQGNFSVAPQLPAGLTLDPTNGTISGTPAAVAPATTYTVEAIGSGGRVATSLSLTVIDQVPAISYAPDTWDLAQNTPMPQAISPTVRGGAVVTWTVDRPLPAGLHFDTASGQISGTPTEVSPRTPYVVTGSNSGGASSTTLTLSVQPMSASGGATLRSAQLTLSVDGIGHAVLRNHQTGTVLATFDDVTDAEGRLPCAADQAACRKSFGLAGNTAVLQLGNTLAVLDGVSGAVMWRIELPAATRWWQLAEDGGYVVAATDAQMTVWSRTGAVLFTRTANYAGASAFAAANELRIGGAAASRVIETISVPGGVTRISAPHDGSFLAWIDHGERFTARAGGQIWIYSCDAKRVGIMGPVSGTTAGDPAHSPPQP